MTVQQDIAQFNTAEGTISWVKSITLTSEKHGVTLQQKEDENIPLEVLRGRATSHLAESIMKGLEYHRDVDDRLGLVTHRFSINNCTEKERDINLQQQEMYIEGLREVQKVRTLGFFQRLKFLFKGCL